MATYAIGLNVVPREALDVHIGDAVYMQIHVCMYLNTNSLTNWVLNVILVSVPTSCRHAIRETRERGMIL